MRRQIELPPGWVIAEPFDSQSVVVTLAAGAGVNATAQQIITSAIVPPAARVLVDRITFRVVDMAAYDQVQFSLRHRGARIPPWDRISGEQTVDDRIVDVGQVFEGGLLEIAGTNISGTSETGATEALDVRVIARWYGYLLRRVDR